MQPIGSRSFCDYSIHQMPLSLLPASRSNSQPGPLEAPPALLGDGEIENLTGQLGAIDLKPGIKGWSDAIKENDFEKKHVDDEEKDRDVEEREIGPGITRVSSHDNLSSLGDLYSDPGSLFEWEDEPSVPKEVTIEEIREVLHLPFLPPVGELYRVIQKGTLLDKIAILQEKFLGREGAFGYQEVYNPCAYTLGNIRKKALENREMVTVFSEETPLPDIRDLVDENLGLLQEQLDLLKERLCPYTYAFREILVDSAVIDQGTNPSSAIDPSKMDPVMKRLYNLEEEILAINEIVEKNIQAFWPLFKMCREIEKGNIQGLCLRNLKGDVKVIIPGEGKVHEDVNRECNLLRELYLNYRERILDSHRTYCVAFLGATNRFRLYPRFFQRIQV